MDAVRYYQRGWAEVQRNLGGWILFYGVFFVASMLTCGTAGVLAPNALREIRDVHREGRAPELGRLFQMDRLEHDLVNFLIYYAAVFVGSAVGGLGAWVAMALLQFLMPLTADDRHDPIDNAKLSLQHVTQHLSDHIIFSLLGVALALASAAPWRWARRKCYGWQRVFFPCALRARRAPSP